MAHHYVDFLLGILVGQGLALGAFYIGRRRGVKRLTDWMEKDTEEVAVLCRRRVLLNFHNELLVLLERAAAVKSGGQPTDFQLGRFVMMEEVINLSHRHMDRTAPEPRPADEYDA